jgi:hypothetical protein
MTAVDSDDDGGGLEGAGRGLRGDALPFPAVTHLRLPSLNSVKLSWLLDGDGALFHAVPASPRVLVWCAAA